MKQLQDILGQDRVLSLLKRRISNENLRGSFLLSGPAGVGKRSTAYACVAKLFCEKNQEDACGHCANCQQVSQGLHNDMVTLGPDETGSIKIEVIRTLLQKMQLQAMRSAQKFAIIDHCECLTRQAANALLKNLEEPGETGTYFLITSTPRRLLATIRSRCQEIKFSPLSEELLAQVLKKDRTENLSVAGGSLTQAKLLEQVSDDIGMSLPELFILMKTKPYHEIEAILKELPDDAPSIMALFEAFHALCRDLLLLIAGQDETKIKLHFPQLIKYRKTLMNTQNNNDVLKFVETLKTCRRALQSNSPAGLVWETLALSLQSTH
jgi:DNA polymerase III subunit delta'